MTPGRTGPAEGQVNSKKSPGIPQCSFVVRFHARSTKRPQKQSNETSHCCKNTEPTRDHRCHHYSLRPLSAIVKFLSPENVASCRSRGGGKNGTQRSPGHLAHRICDNPLQDYVFSSREGAPAPSDRPRRTWRQGWAGPQIRAPLTRRWVSAHSKFIHELSASATRATDQTKSEP